MKRTALYDRHVAAGARMIDFGGWDMPVLYRDIQSEHRLVREKAGLFDLCHMGRVVVKGPDAAQLVQSAQTNDLDKIGVGQIRYAMLLEDDGGVIDDILVHRRADDIFLVVNGANYDTDVARLRQIGEGMNATVEALDELGMIAVQGPLSPDVIKALDVPFDVDALGYYRLIETEVLGRKATVTRTGYTGEDGFEIYFPTDGIAELWDRCLEVGAEQGLAPCGLGARDTLRLEAGMPLYGHEITRDVNPIEAGLTFGIRLKKPEYPGRDAVAAMKKAGPPRKLIGLVLEGRRIARDGYPVTMDGETVGHVCSGTWSPTFETSIATALVKTEALDGELSVDLRGKPIAARRVDMPFYKRDGSGSLNS